MSETFMILPVPGQAPRLLRVPDDYERHEAYRHVTAVMAAVQEREHAWDWEDLLQALEVHGFTAVDCVLGPVLERVD